MTNTVLVAHSRQVPVKQLVAPSSISAFSMQQLLIASSVSRHLEDVVADCLTVSQAIKHYIDIAFLTTWVQLLPNLLFFFFLVDYITR